VVINKALGWSGNRLSDSESKPDWEFVHIGPFRKIHRSILKHDASVFILDEANGGFCCITGFSLPDHFHRGLLSDFKHISVVVKRQSICGD